ncbi:hypothetical protein BDP55DRAFT_685500 [Colletotrichum godetiae]|uniref:Uncharacterized protein n=1 Tax=Colletotrichum godetiae TaxID=1209918 RepID=A0AAJ0A6P6_9PEZI|nr:uncharacterized protein BDP55DRAFT_685500 [Colletotrichum godetiae]KAK1657493.1 hypothetical protein BDP55DRAFT_685500 [Colletotrichum godetiae]
MCDWCYRIFACGHWMTGAEAWCYEYGRNQKPCKVTVDSEFQYPTKCKKCEGSRDVVAWEHMIDRSKSHMIKQLGSIVLQQQAPTWLTVR